MPHDCIWQSKSGRIQWNCNPIKGGDVIECGPHGNLVDAQCQEDGEVLRREGLDHVLQVIRRQIDLAAVDVHGHHGLLVEPCTGDLNGTPWALHDLVCEYHQNAAAGLHCEGQIVQRVELVDVKKGPGTTLILEHQFQVTSIDRSGGFMVTDKDAVARARMTGRKHFANNQYDRSGGGREEETDCEPSYKCLVHVALLRAEECEADQHNDGYEIHVCVHDVDQVGAPEFEP
mmetsp:Transcript_21619/g.69979  ORF Transcript_21619/g.69979 Transcript_21619/m.69979 type:complete len:231 (+) Transcript_21619:1074-1766(+)